MFKLTSLNLNGIRSAASKGLEDWVAQSMPDCICVQELKAQAADVSGKFEEIAGLKGHFHFAEKKGYSGVAVYTKHEPSDVVVGYGSTEFDAEGRYVELRFDRPGRKHCPKLSIISCYFPSGSSGEERQAAKFRFLAEFYPYLAALKQTRDFVLCGDINIAHQEIDLKNFKGNKKNSGFLPEERAWMTELLRDAELANEAADELTKELTPRQRAVAWSMSTASCSPPPPTPPTPGGATAARPMPRTWAGGSTTTWRRPPLRRWPAANISTRSSAFQTTRP